MGGLLSLLYRVPRCHYQLTYFKEPKNICLVPIQR